MHSVNLVIISQKSNYQLMRLGTASIMIKKDKSRWTSLI